MSKHYDGLDFLWAIAMLLGIVLHAEMLYVDTELIYKIDPELLATLPEPSLTIFTSFVWIHLWRMPLFFILAGFFAHIVLERKGVSYFAKDRITRILLPLLLFMGVYAVFFNQKFTDLVHLWFLYYLFLFYILLLGARLFTISFIDKFYSWLFSSRVKILWLIIPITILNFWARDDSIWSSTPKNIWSFEGKTFIYLLFFFVIGYFLSKNKYLFDKIISTNYIKTVLLCGIIFFTLGVFASLQLEDLIFKIKPFVGGFIIAAYIMVYLIAICMGIALFCWCFGLIALSLRLFSTPQKWISFLVKISYPIYLFHLLFTVLFALLFITKQIDQHIAIPLNFLLTFILCVSCYFIFVKYTPLSWLLNGYHNSVLKFKFLDKSR